MDGTLGSRVLSFEETNMSKHQSPAEGSRVHPIANLLLRSLRPGEGSEYSVSTESLREIGSMIEQLVQTKDFLPAVTTLIRFCKVLEARGSGRAARAIIGAAQRAVPELERITGAHSASHAAVARERFARLLGDTRPQMLPTQTVDRGRAAQGMLAFRAPTRGSEPIT
jgi:hypothetical protein